ncbi:hypothetical protein VB780_11475 [Leptolyngbya sp. CCNP1308]|uniref:alr0857 family protein n=1 Tax=Leptolyngbya sp. CCNP1308 TaxID=3110255 RepID=UPI002B202FE8|nr:alr0857 family protein [Leptolyngbya sp. CCNP1308]MEA5449192.1 hypothetical protein [Leptolyngbya sp. CCNP1308]
MLKLTYSDADLLIEHLELTVEAMVTQRSLVALRAGQPLVVQPGYGAFALPADLATDLDSSGLEIAPCDHGWLEVTLRGTWLTDCASSAEGILVVELGFALERQIVALWQRSLCWVAAPCSQGG